MVADLGLEAAEELGDAGSAGGFDQRDPGAAGGDAGGGGAGAGGQPTEDFGAEELRAGGFRWSG